MIKMIKRINMYMPTIMLVILTIFVVTSVATAKTSPASIGNLHVISHGTNYIYWGWTDPTSSDFSHVDIYINGVFKISVPKGIKHYKAAHLTPNTVYTIGTHTVDNYGNVNPILKTNTQNTDSGSGGGSGSGNNTIRFITIGDPHLVSNTSANQYQRLERAINYINGRKDVDFAVILGDIVDSTSTTNFGIAKTLLSKLNKPYYVVEGNHDIGSSPGANFRTYIGPTERMVNINGYQLIFVGITRDVSGANHWSFNYNTADKSKPTIIFDHGPVQPKPGATSCSAGWGSYFGYACDMKSETDKFTNLLAFYAGHVHTGTSQTINGVLYVTADNLGGNGPPADYIGYTKIQHGTVSYSLVLY